MSQRTEATSNRQPLKLGLVLGLSVSALCFAYRVYVVLPAFDVVGQPHLPTDQKAAALAEAVHWAMRVRQITNVLIPVDVLLAAACVTLLVVQRPSAADSTDSVD